MKRPESSRSFILRCIADGSTPAKARRLEKRLKELARDCARGLISVAQMRRQARRAA